MPVRNLILILGDQLTPTISSLRGAEKDRDRILMAEVAEEATYVRHHKKKIAFVFSAMRHFAEELAEAGWTVDYVQLGDADNSGSLKGEVERAVKRLKPSSVSVTEPGEYRLLADFKGWDAELGVPVDIRPDARFLCSRSEFEGWADGRKRFLMEDFCRHMRVKTGLLMDGDKPAGGKWNFDKDNRKPAAQDLFMPRPRRFEPDEITQNVLSLVETRFSEHFGALDPFWFAVTRDEARQAFDDFLDSGLPRFGDFQDAMLRGEPFLYHAVVSPYLNAGLLDPMELCQAVDQAYRDGKVPINSAEGFIRQIIGWREYVCGIYWLRMPEMADENFLGATRDLPSFYWSGETDMTCLKEAITQTRDEAYAHHIQRLMITGNFAMLAGIEPRQVHEWYLAVYADAYEWVEMPNTLGMSQFADGGFLASKPYASGGNYIRKMSDYCGSCRYDVAQKTGEDACPFNALYWDFLDRNAERLRGNRRLATAYSTWERMGEAKQDSYRDSAHVFLQGLS
ncbi:cryptochrome/photolyase family protein [uncultured Roseibium sp.]|uniref:cryptochrome/photolyase family protein n=1 Tax=uncultured Roseibium sp. TaxID=1936171 RepID=UPI002592363E|nr:cryptochrome/photolyase family protein [uncultured Roseibium sp.]